MIGAALAGRVRAGSPQRTTASPKIEMADLPRTTIQTVAWLTPNSPARERRLLVRVSARMALRSSSRECPRREYDARPDALARHLYGGMATMTKQGSTVRTRERS